MNATPVVIGDALLYLGDCLEILPTLGKVDAVVTSPPYLQQRNYEKKIDDWPATVGILAEISGEDCQILINLGLIYRNGELIEYWDSLKTTMRSAGWRLFGLYIWDKGFGAPGNWNGRLAPAHEFIFHFNRRPIVVSKWVSTNPIYRSRRKLGTGLRMANGKMSGISSPNKCGQLYKIPDSVLRITPQQARNGLEVAHPAVYPVDVPAHLIRSFSSVGHIILDPFMGSGTTGVACARLGRKFIGIEIEPKYFDIACRRIEQAYAQPRLFADTMSPKAQPQELFPNTKDDHNH